MLPQYSNQTQHASVLRTLSFFSKHSKWSLGNNGENWYKRIRWIYTNFPFQLHKLSPRKSWRILPPYAVQDTQTFWHMIFQMGLLVLERYLLTKKVTPKSKASLLSRYAQSEIFRPTTQEHRLYPFYCFKVLYWSGSHQHGESLR